MGNSRRKGSGREGVGNRVLGNGVRQKPKVTGGKKGDEILEGMGEGKGEGTRAGWGKGRRVRGGAEEREEAG